MINPSAGRHGITHAEIRCVVEYSILVVRVPSRMFDDALPTLHVGRYDDNEPLIEVVTEQVGDALEVFHAMFLRQATINAAGIGDYISAADLTQTQRK